MPAVLKQGHVQHCAALSLRSPWQRTDEVRHADGDDGEARANERAEEDGERLHQLQLWYRRAAAWSMRLGTSLEHRRTISRLLALGASAA